MVWVDIHPIHPRVHSGPECTRGWFRMVPWVVWVDTEWIVSYPWGRQSLSGDLCWTQDLNDLNLV